MLIGGAWVESDSGARFTAESPATGETIGTVPEGTREDARRAIAAANEAWHAWAASSAFDRAATLERVAELVAERREALARTLTLDQGKPLVAEAFDEVDELAGYFRQAAADGTRLEGSLPPSVDASKRVLVYRAPRGVVGVITPWNWPYTMPAEVIAPALAAGNAVVWAAAPSTSVCAVALAECVADAGVPAGVLNLVTGPGPVVGDEIASSPGTHAVAFIGSIETGHRVAERAAGKALLLEMGGNGPFVVLDDADVARAAEAALPAAFLCAGQSCTAGERFLVHERVHDEFLDALSAAIAREIRLGDPFDEATTMGPLNNEPAAEKVDRHVDEALERGAELVVEGGRDERPPDPALLPADGPGRGHGGHGDRARGDVRPGRAGDADPLGRGGAHDRERVTVRAPDGRLDERPRTRAPVRRGCARGLGERQRVDELLGEPPAVRRPVGLPLRSRPGRRSPPARRLHGAEDGRHLALGEQRERSGRSAARRCDGHTLRAVAARKTVTVLFSDIVDSTRLGEQLDPESLRRVLGRYFDESRTILERHGGHLEKFIGDAVVADLRRADDTRTAHSASRGRPDAIATGSAA